jgi:hypothetical protein
MTKHELVLDFIKQYQKFGSEVIDCFSNGMCYHFAEILKLRFGYSRVEIMYDPIQNHFAANIDDRIYDITGDLTDNEEYQWFTWDRYRKLDILERDRIIRYCVLKAPDDTRICECCEHCYCDDWGTDICDIDSSPVDYYGPCTKGEF